MGAAEMTTWRYPDKPVGNMARAGLDELRDGDWLAQLKMDGWRCVITKDEHGRITCMSRHREPLPIPQNEIDKLAQDLDKLPKNSVLDGEWMGRRSKSQEPFWLFDALQIAGGPLYQFEVTKRVKVLAVWVPSSIIVPTTTGGYGQFFDWYASRPDAEGIVLKAVNSTYIGSVRGKSADNPSWTRCKWRLGEDGRTPA